MKSPRQIIFLLFVIVAFFWSGQLVSQNKLVDSLNVVLKTAKSDTTRARVLVNLTEELYGPFPDTVIPMCKLAIEMADKNLKACTENEKKSYLLTKGDALHNIAFVYSRRGDISFSYDFELQSLKIREEINDKKGQANCYSSMAVMFDNKGDVKRALEYHNKALSLFKLVNDKNGISLVLNNIGFIYSHQGMRDEAIEIYNKCMAIKKEINDFDGMAVTLDNIAGIWMGKADYVKAKECYDQSMKLRTERNNKWGIAKSYLNLGAYYNATGDKEKLKESYLKSIELNKEISNKYYLSFAYTEMAKIYLKEAAEPQNKDRRNSLLADARKYAAESLGLAKSMGNLLNLRASELIFFRIEEKLGNDHMALQHLKEYINYNDSLVNDNTKKTALRNELNYEFDKKAVADSIKNAEEKKLEEVKHQQEISKQRIYTVTGIVGFVVMIIVAAMSFVALRNNKRINSLIEHQKNLVEEKQKSILDSIYYARRIQRALITNEKYIDKKLNALKRFSPKS